MCIAHEPWGQGLQQGEKKETYYSVKRDLLQCQKRPTTVSKETYYSAPNLGDKVFSKERACSQKKRRLSEEMRITHYQVPRTLQLEVKEK